MPLRNLGWFLGITSFFIFGTLLARAVPPEEEDYALFRLMVDIWHEVDQRYERKLTPEEKRQLMVNMINGGLEQLDRHSRYIPPDEYKELTDQTKGEFGGIGIQIQQDPKTGDLVVVTPMPGTPAYKAGILPGDIILKIDGVSTDDADHEKKLKNAVDKIKGKEGEKIVLTVVHEGSQEPVDIEVVRAKIKVLSVVGARRKPYHEDEWDYYADERNKIGYVRLTQFSETTADELRKIVKKLQQDGVRGLVIDLRDNPGGLLAVAVDVCDLFLDEGVIVTVRGRAHDEEVYKAKKKGELTEQGHVRSGPLAGQVKEDTLLSPREKFPMTVLINRNSASASEIVAAALQDHGRAVVVGERSYGKGSVQNIILMENKTSALKLTTARYWRPSGRNINRDKDSKDNDEWGVRPNLAALGALTGGVGAEEASFAVKLSDKERRQRLDAQRDAEIAFGPLVAASSARTFGLLLGQLDLGTLVTVPLHVNAHPEARSTSYTEQDQVIWSGQQGSLILRTKTLDPAFTDRVLERALDYIRGRIREAAAVAVPVRGDA